MNPGNLLTYEHGAVLNESMENELYLVKSVLFCLLD